MKKPQFQSIIPHIVPYEGEGSLPEQVAALHGRVISRRLRQSGLTAEQKAAVLGRLLAAVRDGGEYSQPR